MITVHAVPKLRGTRFFICSVPRFVFLVTFAIVLFLSSHPAYSAKLTLAWDPSTDSDLAGYKLHYGYASRDYVFHVNVGNQTQYTIPDLDNCKSYFFTATTYNTSGVESDYSDEVTYTTLGTYSLSPTSQSFNTSRGQGSVSVTTQSNCSWSVTNNYPWITIISGGSGIGSRQVNYSVSANTSTSSRTATLTIAGRAFTITQQGTATYFITATAGTGGSISPSGPVVVNRGASQNFTITANTDYVIADVKADGVSVGAVSSYTFSNVTANYTIEASFSTVTYTLTIAKSGTGRGTVTYNPPGTTFLSGTVVTLTATADANSTFEGWSGGATGTSLTCTVTINANTGALCVNVGETLPTQ